MKALALTGVRQFELAAIPKPRIAPASVLIRVAAVGLCGTDLHIYNGEANYHLDAACCPVPLASSPQILGHELAGIVEAVGPAAQRCLPGDLVTLDQVLSCRSKQRSDLCEYCETGDSHQCLFAEEYGITGIPGGFAEFIAVPEINVLHVSEHITPLEAALAEPVGCIVHAQDRVERAQTRYNFNEGRRIKHIAILGAGPSGLLFLQYLRSVKRFEGEILLFDQHDAKLALAHLLGGTPVDVRVTDASTIVRTLTRGEGIQYLIEATGNGKALQLIPKLVRKQATLLIYGGGHSDLVSGCLTPWQSMELDVVSSAGASGRIVPGEGPETYARALQLISDGKINVACLVSHRYNALHQLPQAFASDWRQDDFIKAVFLPQHATPLTGE